MRQSPVSIINKRQSKIIRSEEDLSKNKGMQRNYDHMFKMVLVGSSAVGKTAILKRFADDQFDESFLSTIGVDFRFKSLNVDDLYVKLQIWDTAGQERFHTLTRAYYKGAHAIIIVFDAQNPQSFEELRNYWLHQIQTNIHQCIIYCFANKCDERYPSKVTRQQQQFMETMRMQLFEVSAKTGRNINEAILEIVKELCIVHPKIQKIKTTMELAQHHPIVTNKKKCC